MAPKSTRLEFVREVNFAPSIVFDALIDPDLLGGWLADAVVDPRVDGDFDLVWLAGASLPPTHGVITVLDEPFAIEVVTDNRGRIRFELSERKADDGGARTTLALTTDVAVDAIFLPRVVADWQISLDQLEALLHGRPVDWTTWDRDRSSAWREYFARAGGY